MIHDHNEPVHSGNRYTNRVRRVLTKLAELGVEIPSDALAITPPIGYGAPLVEFSRIEHAMLDWFEDRDYRQAQALIHHQDIESGWQVIRLLDANKGPSDISDETLAPTQVDALGAMINACDVDTIRIDACRKEGEALVIAIGGFDVVRIEPVILEPFNKSARDRVRSAFKGVREYDNSEIHLRLCRLPGFKSAIDQPNHQRNRVPPSCMLLGFPGNWAVAMRHALKQVGIAVPLNQAQDVAAAFLGASHWHQLTRHQDEITGSLRPTALAINDGTQRRVRFFHTPEEAIFALGKCIEGSPEPLLVTTMWLTTSKQHVYCSVSRRSEIQRQRDPLMVQAFIYVGANDYVGEHLFVTDEERAAAKRMIARMSIEGETVTTSGVLYDDASDASLLSGILARRGIPPEQTVSVGDHVVAVSYVDEPDGGPRHAANALIYKITEHGPAIIDNGFVEMYKAEVDVVQDMGVFTLIIRPDYGKKEPIRIAAASAKQIHRLISLTHKPDLFRLEPLGSGFRSGVFADSLNDHRH